MKVNILIILCLLVLALAGCNKSIVENDSIVDKKTEYLHNLPDSSSIPNEFRISLYSDNLYDDSGAIILQTSILLPGYQQELDLLQRKGDVICTPAINSWLYEVRGYNDDKQTLYYKLSDKFMFDGKEYYEADPKLKSFISACFQARSIEKVELNSIDDPYNIKTWEQGLDTEAILKWCYASTQWFDYPVDIDKESVSLQGALILNFLNETKENKFIITPEYIITPDQVYESKENLYDKLLEESQLDTLLI
ncbi:hypothetical protein [Diplocloster hominis]|uniref:hypothetical protein n=1 Tax=Diplocloster hominis TaxID=3079010 RepID=UPI0031BB4A84